MALLDDDFTPAAGLADGHLQTFYAALVRKPSPVPLVRRRVETPDGDFVDVDVLEGRPGAPTVLLLHGLEGSSASTYITETVRLVAARGWGAWALNFRSCSGEPNRHAASYCSGDTRDLLFLLPQLSAPRFAVGFSLGASVLLNALARHHPALDAAVAVCPPFQLDVSARAIDSPRGFGPVYLRHFLPSLKAKALVKAARHPTRLDARAVRAIRTIRGFDDVVTAPLFGFESAEDYYEGCSTAPLLRHLRTPTLLLCAEDDPIAPASTVPGDACDNPAVDLLRTRMGGHVAYATGSVLKPRWWGEARLVEWLARHAPR